MIFCASCASDNAKKEDPAAAETPNEQSILVDVPDVKVEGGQDVDDYIRETEVAEAVSLAEFPEVAPILMPVKPKEASDGTMYKELFSGINEKAMIKVCIDFNAAPLTDVIPAFATPLKLNYIIDPEVQGTVTMSADSSMTAKEVWTLFNRILYLSDAYCEVDGKVLHIRPAQKITREGNLLNPGARVGARVVHLKHVTAASLAATLGKFASSESSITVMEKQNALLLADTVDNLDRLEMLIFELDREARTGWRQIVLPCRNVSSDQIKDELLELLPVLGFPVSGDKDKDKDPGAIELVSLPRVQVIVASAANAEALDMLRKWVTALDKADVGEQQRVYVYDVVNSQADDLLQALSALFPVEGSVLKAAATTTEGGTTGGASTESVSGRRTAGKEGKDGDKVSSGNIFDTTLYIFADAKNNRMLIRTTPRAYSMAKAILSRIDTIPDRVLLQVLVVEIELGNSNEFGMEFSAKYDSGGNTESIIGTNFEALKPSADSAQTGGRYYIFNPDDPDQKFGYIRALAGRNKMKVLSSPQIVATSHSEAKISVGKKVPLVTSDITDTASSSDDTTSLLRSYQYEDTGIILTVKPYTTKGGLIGMEIEQIISEAQDNTQKGVDSPIIKQDELKTTLAFRSGRTLIMGGLIKEKSVNTTSSLPLAADIPLLRNVFGNTSQTVERTEILVLVTASIITENSDLQDMVMRYRNAVKEIKKFEKAQFEEPEAEEAK